MPTGAPMTAANEKIKSPYLALEKKQTSYEYSHVL